MKRPILPIHHTQKVCIIFLNRRPDNPTKSNLMTNREIITRLLQILKPYSSRLIIAMVAMVVVAGFNAAQAYMVKPLLDEIFVNKDSRLLNLLPLALVLLFVVKGIFFFLYSYTLEWVGQCVIRDLRNRIYSHLNTLSLSFYQKTPTGELISRIMNDVSLLQGAVSHALIRILRDFFSVIGLIGVIFYMDWRLALISLIFLPMATVPIVFFGKKYRWVSIQFQKTIATATNILHETIGGARIVKAFCMEQFEEKRFARIMDQLFKVLMAGNLYRCISHPMIEFLGGIGMALIIWFGGVQVLQGHSTPGTFMSFLAALVMLYEPIKGVSKINATIQDGLASASRIFATLDVQPEIHERSDAHILPPFHDHIAFTHVTFAYDRDRPVLHDITLHIAQGEILAIVGPSGSGKTTLANLVPRFYDVTHGMLRIDGHDVRELTLNSLRSQIALVSQQTILFNDTVRNNIAYGREDWTEEEIIEAARNAYALEFIRELPHGFDTVVGESGTRLSGGQQQRLSIARALLKNAPILILDEATSSLDTESERQVQSALDNLMQNRTTIVIAHRLSTIRNVDRIVVMKNGQLVEQGTHIELLAREGLYAELHQLQYDR